MNYRNEIICAAALRAAQEYSLPVDYFLLNAAEVMAENWFAGDFEYACGMDAQDAAGDSSLAHLVMVKYFELEQEANRVGAGF
jgi:hypothetical protein